MIKINLKNILLSKNGAKKPKNIIIDHKIKINLNKGIDSNRINEIRKIKLENNFIIYIVTFLE